MLKRLFVVLAAAGMLALSVGVARAQVDFPTSQSGINSRGETLMCLDASNVSQPSSATNPCPVKIQSGTLTSSGYSASVTLTRTNDTAPYAANDVVGAATGSTAALTFPTMGPSGGEIIITSVCLQINDTAIISGETSYNLETYNVTPPSALGDNVAFDIPAGDRTAHLDTIPLGTPVDKGSTLKVCSDILNKQLKLSGTSLFGYLTTATAYTPTAQRAYVITLHSVAM